MFIDFNMQSYYYYLLHCTRPVFHHSSLSKLEIFKYAHQLNFVFGDFSIYTEGNLRKISTDQILYLKKYEVNFSLALESIHVTVIYITSNAYNERRITATNSDLKTWEN